MGLQRGIHCESWHRVHKIECCVRGRDGNFNLAIAPSVEFTLHHVAIASSDPAKLSEFYETAFGMKQVQGMGGAIYLSDGTIYEMLSWQCGSPAAVSISPIGNCSDRSIAVARVYLRKLKEILSDPATATLLLLCQNYLLQCIPTGKSTSAQRL